MNEITSDIVYVVAWVCFLCLANVAVNRINKAFTKAEKKKEEIV